MTISKKIGEMMERSSWIRRMFDEGTKLKEKLGADNVFDFTLGNPVGEPPVRAEKELERLVTRPTTGSHRYMPNAGLPDARAMIAAYLSRRSNLPFGAENVIMTVGAGGALNVIIKALCDPGDEIVTIAPYFAEYTFYADNHQAKLIITESDEWFQPVAENIEKAFTDKMRIVLLNSPNNPTGAVYPMDKLAKVAEAVERHSKKTGRPVYIVMDEPYRKLVYEGVEVPDVFAVSRRVIVATSHSKDLNLPGERIGYIAIHPEIEGVGKIFDAMTLANRILGFVNAPALFQRLVASLQDIQPDMGVYAQNRRILVNGLKDIGYSVIPPDGGFYIFAKSPIKDDVKFVDILKKRNVLVVPGTGFGRGGYFRIAFCCSPEQCERSLPGFREAFEEAITERS